MPGKAPIYKLSSSKAPKAQSTCGYRHATKTSELFNETARASTLAPEIILVTEVLF